MIAPAERALDVCLGTPDPQFRFIHVRGCAAKPEIRLPRVCIGFQMQETCGSGIVRGKGNAEERRPLAEASKIGIGFQRKRVVASTLECHGCEGIFLAVACLEAPVSVLSLQESQDGFFRSVKMDD